MTVIDQLVDPEYKLFYDRVNINFMDIVERKRGSENMKFLGKVSQLESVGCLHQTSTLVNILEQILVQLSHFLKHNNWEYLNIELILGYICHICTQDKKTQNTTHIYIMYEFQS